MCPGCVLQQNISLLISSEDSARDDKSLRTTVLNSFLPKLGFTGWMLGAGLDPN